MTYSNELKEQIVMLYNNGKLASEIMGEFNVSSSALYRWIKNYNNLLLPFHF